MHMRSQLPRAPLVFAALGLMGCGGSSRPASAVETAPATTGSAAAADTSQGPDAGSQSAAAHKAPSRAETQAAQSETTEYVRSPRETLSRKEILYKIAFEDSDVGRTAGQACTKQSGNDPNKRAACLTRARATLDFDGIVFTQDDKNDWWWIAIRRKGKAVASVHKIRFEFGDEKGKTIAIKLEGQDKGSKPMARVPSTMTFEIESDYRINATDPKYGKLVYDAKIGLDVK